MKASLTILNLEDNVNDAELNGEMLSARWPHCRVVRVDTRPAFLAAVAQGDVDLILSDYTMPHFSGREALTLAQEKCPEIPFLFVSGTIGEDAAVEALKSGATDYVLKHRLMRLIPAVDRALREVEERSERLRAEATMRESEHKYRELFECLSDAAFLADENTGKIIDTNRSAAILTGHVRENILGRRVSQVLSPDPFREKINGTGPDTPPVTVAECGLVRSDGGIVAVRVRATRLILYGRSLVLRLCHPVG